MITELACLRVPIPEYKGPHRDDVEGPVDSYNLLQRSYQTYVQLRTNGSILETFSVSATRVQHEYTYTAEML
jgi:hypothetical protein